VNILVALSAAVTTFFSGSREAQRLLFANTQFGNLTPHLNAYFDTTVGPKRSKESYEQVFICCAQRLTQVYFARQLMQIALFLGVADRSEIMFVTDVFEEGKAAEEAGELSHCLLSAHLSLCTRIHTCLTVKDTDGVMFSGCQVALSVREGNAPLPQHSFSEIMSFDQL
jgi:methionine salvage enolase-phosphatase E1